MKSLWIMFDCEVEETSDAHTFTSDGIEFTVAKSALKGIEPDEGIIEVEASWAEANLDLDALPWSDEG